MICAPYLFRTGRRSCSPMSGGCSPSTGRQSMRWASSGDWSRNDSKIFGSLLPGIAMSKAMVSLSVRFAPVGITGSGRWGYLRWEQDSLFFSMPLFLSHFAQTHTLCLSHSHTHTRTLCISLSVSLPLSHKGTMTSIFCPNNAQPSGESFHIVRRHKDGTLASYSVQLYQGQPKSASAILAAATSADGRAVVILASFGESVPKGPHASLIALHLSDTGPRLVCGDAGKKCTERKKRKRGVWRK